MSKTAMTLALEALELLVEERSSEAMDDGYIAIKALEEALAKQEQRSVSVSVGEPVCDKDPQGCYSVRCQLGNKCKNTPQPKQEQGEPVAKLQVTLEDRPIDIELAQYKRMFEAACSALGAVSDALGCDPEEGGAEPLLAAIAELKNTKQEQGEPVAYLVKHFQGDEQVLKANSDVMPVFFKSPEHFTCEPLYTTPQPAQKPWVGLTDEQMKENFETWHKETYVQSLEGYGDTYKNMHVRNRWQGWLAAHGIKENT